MCFFMGVFSCITISDIASCVLQSSFLKSGNDFLKRSCELVWYVSGAIHDWERQSVLKICLICSRILLLVSCLILLELTYFSRDFFEKGVRAFVSFIQSYSKHECNMIFRLKGTLSKFLKSLYLNDFAIIFQ